MRRCCFLSMDDLGSYVSDDDLAVAHLAALGWQPDTVSWRDKSVDWNDFEAVIIRTPWDYQRDPDKFLQVLENIESSSAHLENSLDIVRWNLNKKYLADLESKGIAIVPTIWKAKGISAAEVDGWLGHFGTTELVIKPTVSATAEHTYRISRFDPELTDVFEEREYMVQPFMPAIVQEGEYSLFDFDGEFSHAILKTPKTKDFRVQEEHGGIIKGHEPDGNLRAAAKRVFDAMGEVPLYARVDLVRDENDNFLVMELELIEPSLYLRMDAGAPERFARAFDARMRRII